MTVFLDLTFFNQPRRAAPQARTRAAPHGAESQRTDVRAGVWGQQ